MVIFVQSHAEMRQMHGQLLPKRSNMAAENPTFEDV